MLLILIKSLSRSLMMRQSPVPHENLSDGEFLLHGSIIIRLII